jgi:CMP-N,N'-diacetyllegionaminic acid synthase
MYKGKKILALIPARGGSKEIPGKNIKGFNGKPLIAWTIEAAKRSKYVDRVIVSTDSTKIAEAARPFGAEVPFMRPGELATDSAPSNLVAVHALDWIRTNEGKEYDYLLLLQATSPLRTSEHIDSAISRFLDDEKAKSLVSVSKVRENPCWMKKVNSQGYLEDLWDNNNNASCRQNLPEFYIYNGAIYIVKCSEFLSKQEFDLPPVSYYVMEHDVSLDIDSSMDFQYAEFIHKNKKEDRNNVK